MLIFILLLVGFFMFTFFRSMERPPAVPRGLKIRHFVATLAVVMLTAPAIYAGFLCLTHPRLAFADYYLSKGFAPAWLVFSLNVASIILGAVAWTQSCSLACREQKTRQHFLRVWPFYVIILLMQSVPIAQEKGASVGWIFVFFVVMGGLGLMVYVHFHASSSNDLFLQQNATQ